MFSQRHRKVEIARQRGRANLSDFNSLEAVGRGRLGRPEAGPSEDQAEAEARGTVPPRSTDSRSSRQRCAQGANRFAVAPLPQVALAPD